MNRENRPQNMCYRISAEEEGRPSSFDECLIWKNIAKEVNSEEIHCQKDIHCQKVHFPVLGRVGR